MIKVLENAQELSEKNLKQWYKNSDFWIKNPLRQVVDTKDFFYKRLVELISKCDTAQPTIIDVGCGEGWVLELILEYKLNVKYIGIDFNDIFISHLTTKYKSIDFAEFVLCDVQKGLPLDLIGSADIVLNCFSFFEIADIKSAFQNVSLLLKPKAFLVILTIDQTYLLIAISKTYEELKNNLALYEKYEASGYFFQKIDLGDAESETLEYLSILYSMKDYVKLAQQNDLSLIDYDEVMKTTKFLPKIYQYILFKKD